MNIPEDDNNEQILPRKEAEDTSTKTLPEKEQIVSLPSYSKSYSRTHFESIKFDHTWEINRFYDLVRIKKLITSGSFPEAGQCYIQMNIHHKNEENILSFYIIAKKELLDLPFIISMQPMFITKFGFFKPVTILFGELKEQSLNEYLYNGTLTLRFQFEIFHTVQTNIIYGNETPSSTIFSEDQTSENTILHDSKSDDIKSIKIIINEESYIVPKDLLVATNSAYFKALCNTKKEINMTDELKENQILDSVFEIMLLFIITGPNRSIFNSIEYHHCFQLLRAAHKYDVCDLKLPCERYLVEHINLENAVESIHVAFECNAKSLERHALSFIKFHMGRIAGTKQFQSLPQKYFEKLMKLIEISKTYDERCDNQSLVPSPFRLNLKH